MVERGSAEQYPATSAAQLLDKTERSLRSAKTDEHGFVRSSPSTGAIEVSVSTDSVQRVLSLLSALLARTDAAGVQFRFDPERRVVVAVADGESMDVPDAALEKAIADAGYDLKAVTRIPTQSSAAK